MFPTIRPPHGVLYNAMQKVTPRRVIGQVTIMSGTGIAVNEVSLVNSNGVSRLDRIPRGKAQIGMTVMTNHEFVTDKKSGLVITLISGDSLDVGENSKVSFQHF